MLWDNMSERLPRVLLVEDRAFLRYAFGRLLRLHGYEVMEANDGREALDCIEDFHPQLVVTDLMMPVMDGVELIRQLRADPETADLPVIAITADATAQAEAQAREAGAVDFITKPIDRPSLLDRLRALQARACSEFAGSGECYRHRQSRGPWSAMSTMTRCPSDDRPRLTLLQQREIEARIVGPLIRAFAAELGDEKTLGLVRGVISDLARQSGAGLALALGEATLTAFSRGLDRWKEGGALELEILEQTPERLSFNVTRCRYAEMYRALGLGDLGSSLSCQRDFALIEGFNPAIALTRTQTLMQGAPYCDFRFPRRRGRPQERGD